MRLLAVFANHESLLGSLQKRRLQSVLRVHLRPHSDPGLQEKAHNLDYALLVKPHEVEATLTGAASSTFVT